MTSLGVRQALAVAVTVELVCGLAAAAAEVRSEGAIVTWTMVDVTDAVQQGDAHLVEAGEQTMLIDAGPYESARTKLVEHLERKGIDRLDVVFVSHAHEDHYGGLRALLEAGIEMEQVQVSLPDIETCRREVPWGCKEDDLRRLLDLLRDERIPVEEPIAPMAWDLGDGRSLELVERLDTFGPSGELLDVNDTSMVLRLDVADTSVLFTGDLNTASGRHVATLDLGLREHVLLKVPHHGAESLAPDEFFEAVDPDVALVPGVAQVWRSDRSRRVREWLEARDVPTFVSGEVGTVTVRIGDEVDIDTERAAPPD